VSRTTRWMVVAVVGITAFAVTWWLAESAFGLDRGTAQAIAGLVVGLITVPAGWWFALDPPANRQPVTTADTVSQTGRTRAGQPVVIGVIVVVLIALVGVLYRNSPEARGSDAAASGSTAKAQTVTVNKSVWYRGLKVTVGQVSYDPNAENQVTARLRLENEARSDLDPYLIRMFFRTGTQYFRGDTAESNPIQVLTTSDYRGEFAVDQLNGAFTDAALVFGEGSEVQAVVPLGGGAVVANQPRSVLTSRDFTFHEFKLHIDGCEVRGDFLQNQRQANKGEYVFGCTLSVSLPAGGIHWFDERNLKLQLPNGTAVSAAEPPDELLTDSGIHKYVYTGFTFDWPMPGRYVLQVLDPQSEFTDTYDIAVIV
jgi:hypothetical protein